MNGGWQAMNGFPRPAGRPATEAPPDERPQTDVRHLHRFAVAVGLQDLVRIATRDDAMRRLDLALRLL